MHLDTLSGYRKTYLAASGECAVPGFSPTCDDADNMLTTVELFEDGNYTGWAVMGGTWSMASMGNSGTVGTCGTERRGP